MILTDAKNGVLSFSVSRLDMYVVNQELASFREHAEYLHKNKIHSLQIDCSSLDYIDSSGFGAMIHMTRNCHDDMNIAFCNVSNDIMKVVKLMGIDDILTFNPSS